MPVPASGTRGFDGTGHERLAAYEAGSVRLRVPCVPIYGPDTHASPAVHGGIRWRQHHATPDAVAFQTLGDETGTII